MLGDLAFSIDLSTIDTVGIYLVAVLTVASAAIYLVDWVRHMATGDAATAAGKDPAP